jgi:predicted MFS family arabinose efflux permease
MGGLVLGLLGLAAARNGPMFLVGSLAVGICSTGVQVLVPFATHFVPEERRGRVVGEIMGGVLTGVMLARPVALFIAANFGWRAVFGFSAALTVAIGAVLFALMPRYVPQGGASYGQILGSMLKLLGREPALRRRAAYQGLMFAAFNLFWTAAPVMLVHRFGLTQESLALFALAGAGGALAAPLAGRMADRGLGRAATFVAMVALTAAFFATRWAVESGWMAALVVLTVLIDAAVQVNQITGQRVIFSLAPESRGRTNAIYMTMVFISGAVGSALSTFLYRLGGWDPVSDVGAALGILMLVLFAVAEPQTR